MFRKIEDVILAFIAVLTIGAVLFELLVIFNKGVIELADLLLRFMYCQFYIHYLLQLQPLQD